MNWIYTILALNFDVKKEEEKLHVRICIHKISIDTLITCLFDKNKLWLEKTILLTIINTHSEQWNVVIGDSSTMQQWNGRRLEENDLETWFPNGTCFQQVARFWRRRRKSYLISSFHKFWPRSMHQRSFIFSIAFGTSWRLLFCPKGIN